MISVPVMLTIRISRRNAHFSTLSRSITTFRVLHEENRAEYPPILDLKPEPTVLRQELNYHEKIRNLSTIEEKTIGINMPRFVWFYIVHYNLMYYRNFMNNICIH